MSEHFKIVSYGLCCMCIKFMNNTRLEIRKKFLTNLFMKF